MKHKEGEGALLLKKDTDLGQTPCQLKALPNPRPQVYESAGGAPESRIPQGSQPAEGPLGKLARKLLELGFGLGMVFGIAGFMP